MLLNKIKQIKVDIESLVKIRLEEFQVIKESGSDLWFKELIFCILAANTSSKMASKVTNSISINEFLNLSIDDLKKRLNMESCRFYNKRAEYIVFARKFSDIKIILNEYDSDFEKRDWLVKNIKGIGMKEASHFLRNTGHNSCAILDKHVKNVLFEEGYITDSVRNKSLTKDKYLEIEEILAKIANKLKITQGELDFYIWFIKTNEVLK